MHIADLQRPKPPQNNPFPPHWPVCCQPTAMPAMPNGIQMQLIAMYSHKTGCTLPTYSALSRLRTIRSHHTGLYVANLQHAKPTKALPAMPNCIQMQLIATHAIPPFWLYIADLQRPKTTSEQSVPALACMLPTYSMPNQLKPCRPCPTASKCN